jgi:hypothetical protein
MMKGSSSRSMAMLTQLPRSSSLPVRKRAVPVYSSAGEIERQWVKRFMPREFAQQRGVRLDLVGATIGS